MKTPTLEEVKEHFKNAKIVKCLSDGSESDITKYIYRGIYKDGSTLYWIDIGGSYNNSLMLSKDGKFAEIIEYKETTTELEPIKPNHYKVEITNRKTKESINCDYIDIAKGLGLTNAQFLALRYFRKKGDLDKQINDAKKGIESYKAHLENLELLRYEQQKN